MKVDSTGQPVAEGTFGLYASNISARVLRTYVDPIKDDERVQQVLGDGGYVLDTGSYSGEVVTESSDFRATYDGDSVVAEDGTIVKEDDVVEYRGGGSGKPTLGTIRTLYPIGTLKGTVCASIKEHHGGAPDGYYAITWGQILKVVAKAKSSSGRKIKVGDKIEVKGDDNKTIHTGTVRTPTEQEQKDIAEYIKTDLNWTHMIETAAGSTYYVSEKKLVRFLNEEEEEEGAAARESWKIHGVGDVHLGDKVRFEKVDGKMAEGVVLSYVSTSTQGPMFMIGDDEGKQHKRLGIRITEILATDEDSIDGEGENENMAETTTKKFKKVDVVAEGTQIIIPVGMSRREAVKELERQAAQDELDVNIMELIEGFPLDAAHALMQSMARKFGWVNAMPTPGFFGPQPPTMVGIVVDPDGRTVQIPWGQLAIPGISGKLATGIQFKDNQPVFMLGGTIKQKDKDKVNEIAQMARDYLKDNSIYKGKAIRVKFPEAGTKVFSPLDNQPQFIQTSDVKPEELIFSDDVAKQIAVNIWTPIRSLAACKTARIPLKRGVLLFGRYGVGKTLLASVTARLAVQSGVTFIDLVDSRQLPQAVQFARQFGGMVVIFAEDIDRCDENGTRTDAFNDILNTVDGLTSKTDEVLIVYTTNHIERISKAMLRQGRIDKVINIKEPDAVAAQKLVRLYARHMLPESEDLTEVGTLLAGFIPAAIREVVEQSKLAAIERGDVHNITAEDLTVTAANTKEHMELLKEAPKDDRSELEKFGDAIGNRIINGVVQAWSGDGEDATESEVMRKQVTNITRRRVA